MTKRITAAWRVLRGEWVAKPPAAPTYVYPLQTFDSGCQSSAVITNISWTQPPTFNPERAGRRAVRKHADALRRLAR